MQIPTIHIQLDDNNTPRTINKSVKVKMIVQKHIIAGESIDSIASHYGITVSDVYAALAYYHDNKVEMDATFKYEQAIVEQTGIDGDMLRDQIQKRLDKPN